ncbi:MAG: DUF4139 domain-containing protein [Alphaproteobacteria bacterium]|nr:DUF4139 domain-containing protein [Alphaproteobacteria bacterium]
MLKYFLPLGFAIWSAVSAQAQTVVLPNTGNNVSVSIYNQNLSLVKDMRQAELKSGLNEVVFDGVAQRIQPETAVIYGDEMKIIEQNYNYNLLSYQNFIERNIGKEVNTVRINPKDGENIYERAVLIGSANGQPILRFNYGIDAEFDGRVVFKDIPNGLSNKPTLTAKINAKNSGYKTLRLAYLTDGLSWKTDYVANVINKDKLNLTGWVTINNESGIDYENAKIQLIAGDVNVVRNAVPRMAKGVMLMASASYDMASNDSIEPQNLNSYELYTLPTTTTIKNQQTKQVALIEKTEVKYKKEFNLQTPFYFNSNGDEFEKYHPSITYVINNTADDNLGISLPSGTMRFYENDKNGNLQFIGSAHINNTAKEDTLRLYLGEAFNISVSGKTKKISEQELTRQKQNKCTDIKKRLTYETEVTINNAEDGDNNVIISQHFNNEYKIIKESVVSTEKNATTREWIVPAKAKQKTVLTYTAEIIATNKECN